MRNGRLGCFARRSVGFLAFIFGLMPFVVFASVDGYFQLSGSGSPTFKGSSAVSLANDWCGWRIGRGGYVDCRVIGSEPSSPSNGNSYYVAAEVQMDFQQPDTWSSVQLRAFYLDFSSGEVWNDGTGSCGVPAIDCSAHDGVVIERWTKVGLGGEINVSGCGYTSSGVGLCVPAADGFNCFSDYTGTGLEYSGGDGAPPVPGQDQPPCITGESGSKICGDPQRLQCGSYNGTKYCVSPNDQPGCKHSTSGVSVICAMESDGSAPPNAPTTDFGSPVPVDQTWDHADSNEGVHHMGGWDGGGDNQSGDPAPGSGDAPGTVSDGSDLDGDNNGDGECQSGEDCSGGAPELGENPGVPTTDVQSVTWSSGLPSSATCPAPETISIPFVSGASFQITYQPLCDFAVMIQPLVLAAAYLSAAFILVGGLRK